jgi:PAS domain-containing protein
VSKQSGASQARVIESARTPDRLDPRDTESASCWFAAFEAARDAMVIIDDDRRYVHANVAACELLGVDANGLIGRRVDEFALATTREGTTRFGPPCFATATTMGNTNSCVPMVPA